MNQKRCGVRRLASHEAALRAKWVMLQWGKTYAEKLEPKKCDHCGGWHLKRVVIHV